VSPQQGILRGNESATVTFTFAPGAHRAYDARAACYLLPPRSVAGSAQPTAGAAAAAAAAAGPDDPVVVTVRPEAFSGWRQQQQQGLTVGGGPASPTLPATRVSTKSTVQLTASPSAASVAAALQPCSSSQNLPAAWDLPGSPSGAAPRPSSPGGAQTLAEALEAAGGELALVVRLLAEGTAPTVELRPARQQLGQLRVGYPSRHAITLRNLGDGVLRYQLQAEVVPEEEDAAGGQQPGGSINPGAEIFAAAEGSIDVDFSSGSSSGGASLAAAAAPLPLPGPSAHGTGRSAAGQGLPSLTLAQQPQQGEVVWVEEAQGTLPAKGSKGVTLILFPRQRGPHTIRVRCWASLITSLQQPKQLRTSASASTPSGWWPQQPGVDPAAAPPPPEAASCTLSSLAVFPTLLVTGAASRQGVSKLRAWQQLAVGQLNAQLAAPVGPADLQVLSRELTGTMTTEAGLRLVPEAVHLDLGTHELGGPAAEFELQLSNPTELPVSWELVNYDSPQVSIRRPAGSWPPDSTWLGWRPSDDLLIVTLLPAGSGAAAEPPPPANALQVEPEHWVQPSQPRNEEEQHRDLVAKGGIINAAPLSGALQRRGDSARLVLRYSPSQPGRHSLPLFLRISDGRCVRLQLSGTTVPAARHSLGLSPAQRQLVLQPVALGELASPVQSFLLHNVWSQPLALELDTSPLRRLAEESWGFEVLCFLGPAAAVQVPAWGAVLLQFQFWPLEARTYCVQLPVRLLDTGAVDCLTLVASGVQPEGSCEAPGAAGPLVAPRSPPAAAAAAGGGPDAGPASNNTEPWRGWAGFSCSPVAQLPRWPGAERAVAACASGGAQALVALSCEVLSLGSCLAGGRTSRLVVVSNVSSCPVAFAWESRPGSIAVAAAPLPGCEGQQEQWDAIEVVPSAGGWVGGWVWGRASPQRTLRCGSC
jgi:hypothetical protein